MVEKPLGPPGFVLGAEIPLLDCRIGCRIAKPGEHRQHRTNGWLKNKVKKGMKLSNNSRQLLFNNSAKSTKYVSSIAPSHFGT
jgi:hypothetical protein